MRVICYRRQSLDKLSDELGIERQLKECKRVAKANGFKVDEVITDNNITASKRGRPGYGRLTEMMRSRQVDVVLILRVDRLLRLNDELEELIEIVEKHPVRVITAEGEVDLATPQGRLVARILVSVARAEMETKSARHKLANRQKAEKGLPHICRRPYGYESDGITQVPGEVEVLRTWYDMLMAGQGYKHCAWWANDNGHRTTENKLFYPITIRNMMTRPRYAGVREYEGIEYPAVWDAIFTPEEWAGLQTLIKHKKSIATTDGRAPKYLLTGLLTCGKCGKSLNGMIKRDNPKRPLRPVYHCKQQGETTKYVGCGGVTRNADALEHWLFKCIEYRLDSAALARLIEPSEKGELSTLLDEHQQAKLRKDELADMLADGEIDRAGYNRAVKRVDASLSDLQTQIDQVSAPGLPAALRAGETFAHAWESSGPEWKRSVISLLMEKITIQPSQRKPYYPMDNGTMARFDAEAVIIEWRN